MDKIRKEVIYRIRKEKLSRRMPLVVLIIIFFLIYNFWIPLPVLKWLTVAVLVIYLALGFYYQKKLRNELDEISYDEAGTDEEE
jgi:uncharacterized membrane protein